MSRKKSAKMTDRQRDALKKLADGSGGPTRVRYFCGPSATGCAVARALIRRGFAELSYRTPTEIARGVEDWTSGVDTHVQIAEAGRRELSALESTEAAKAAAGSTP